MKQLLTLCFAVVGLLTGQAALAASGDSAMLQSGDFVGYSFWLISMALVASTAFFFFEANSVAKHWQTSVRVAGLVTLIAAVHYYYMRGVWIQTGENPNVYRYIDWLLTVPLQMIEFYLILAAVGAATAPSRSAKID